MKQKHETLGEFVRHLLDSPQAKEYRKDHQSEDDYQKWVINQISEVLYDEENPSLTLEIMNADSDLRTIFVPFKTVSEMLLNDCSRCYDRIKSAHDAKVNTNQN